MRITSEAIARGTANGSKIAAWYPSGDGTLIPIWRPELSCISARQVYDDLPTDCRRGMLAPNVGNISAACGCVTSVALKRLTTTAESRPLPVRAWRSALSRNHALTSGTHEIVVDGVRQRYHVAGAGAVCIAHYGGPGIAWEYLRMATVEAELTTVYVEPVGTGESGHLPDHPRGYTIDRYSQIYHNWKFDCRGNILDTPNVADPRFKGGAG
jgi:hypothetical protein